MCLCKWLKVSVASVARCCIVLLLLLLDAFLLWFCQSFSLDMLMIKGPLIIYLRGQRRRFEICSQKKTWPLLRQGQDPPLDPPLFGSRDYSDFQTDGNGQILLMFQSNLTCNAARITHCSFVGQRRTGPQLSLVSSKVFFLRSVPDGVLVPCHCYLGFWLA